MKGTATIELTPAIPYKKFIEEVTKRYNAYRKESGNGEVEIALCMNKTTMSVRNCTQPMEQVVSDKVLTTFLNCIKVNAKVEWVAGVRKYYLID